MTTGTLRHLIYASLDSYGLTIQNGMKPLIYSACAVTLFGLAIPALVNPGLAQTPTENAPTAVSPAAILQATANFLKSKSAFTYTNQISYDNVLSGGDKVQYHSLQTVYVQRPNQMRADYEGDFRNTQIYYNGSTFTWLDRDQNLYYQAPAPNNLDDFVKVLIEQHGGPIPMSSFVTSNPFSAYNPQDYQSQYLGMSEVNGVPSYNLLFVGATENWQVFVSADDQPLVQKVIITYKALPGAPQYIAQFTEWTFPSSQPNTLFQFQAPANAMKVSDRSDVLNLNLPAGVAAPDGLTPPPNTPMSPGLNAPNLEPPK